MIPAFGKVRASSWDCEEQEAPVKGFIFRRMISLCKLISISGLSVRGWVLFTCRLSRFSQSAPNSKSTFPVEEALTKVADGVGISSATGEAIRVYEAEEDVQEAIFQVVCLLSTHDLQQASI